MDLFKTLQCLFRGHRWNTDWINPFNVGWFRRCGHCGKLEVIYTAYGKMLLRK